jgi:Flp pilus assembly protein CpaB
MTDDDKRGRTLTVAMLLAVLLAGVLGALWVNHKTAAAATAPAAAPPVQEQMAKITGGC